MSPALSEFCVYTILHSDKLKAASGRRTANSREGKPWITGDILWDKAEDAGELMPIVFADAVDCRRLLYWGILTNIVIEGTTTHYFVKKLRQIRGRHSPQELVLKSTGKSIAPNFIRPYSDASVSYGDVTKGCLHRRPTTRRGTPQHYN